MSIGDIYVANKRFAIDATMSADDVNNAVGKLAAIVQKVADSHAAEVTTGHENDEAQSRVDILEDIVGELENIYAEADTQCPACNGEGTVECRGSDASPCPGDQTCETCNGDGTADCPTCNGTGEIANGIVTNETVREVTAAVADAMRQLPPTAFVSA